MKFGLRPATPADAEQIVDLQIAAWEAAFLPLLPEGFEIPAREQFLLMGDHVLQEGGVERTVADDGGVVGFATHGSSRDEDAADQVGEIRAIFVHPGHWRRGVGAALVSNAVQSLRNAGYREVTLWSFRNNQRANAFYERQGFTRDGATQAREAFRGNEEIRYRRKV